MAAAGLAPLFPVLQYALDLLALRRMTPTAFGTLMALDPAIGLVLGLVVLSQHPSPSSLPPLVLVVLAGAGAQRGGGRPASITTALTNTPFADSPKVQVLLTANTSEPT